MIEQESEAEDGPDEFRPDLSGASNDIAKALRREREKQELLQSLASGNFSAMRTRVAGVLNLYPTARNSDVALALKYWETFQPEVYNRNGILPKDLFQLERFHYLVRARAKIQNEYGLFQADETVKGRRKNREEEMHAAVIEDAAPRRIVSIFADETGKTHEHVIVAAVWVLTGRAVFLVSRAIDTWKRVSSWADREIHFAKFGRNDLVNLDAYLRIIETNREFLSIKVIAVERARTRRSIEEVVVKLHEHMLLRGASHEISTGRLDLPREFELTIDEEQSLDSFTLAEMKTRINAELENALGERAKLSTVQAASSRNSPLIQLADVIAGAVNRSLNHKGERNFKDDMAEQIIERLGIALEVENLPGFDSVALFRV